MYVTTIRQQTRLKGGVIMIQLQLTVWETNELLSLLDSEPNRFAHMSREIRQVLPV